MATQLGAMEEKQGIDQLSAYGSKTGSEGSVGGGGGASVGMNRKVSLQGIKG